MGAAVLMDQHSRHQRTFTTLTMNPALGSFIDATFVLKYVYDPGIAAGSTLAAIPCVDVLGHPLAVTVFVAITQSHDLINRCLPGRSLSERLSRKPSKSLM